jgi:hypothetical protein
MKIPPGNAREISAVIKFNPNGYLKSIFLNCQNDEDQRVLESAIRKLLRTSHFFTIRRSSE